MKAIKKIEPTLDLSSITPAYDMEKNLRKFCEVTSNELSDALGAIAGELDYALTSSKDTDRDKSLLVALSAAERALNLARNLRYFAVHSRLDREPVDLSQLILDAVDLYEKELETKQIRPVVELEDATFASVDPTAMKQLVLNLLAFCCQNLPKGGELRLTLSSRPSPSISFSPTTARPSTRVAWNTSLSRLNETG